MEKHTSLPWIGNGKYVRDSKGLLIAEVTGDTPEEVDANVNLIVCACNSYYKHNEF